MQILLQNCMACDMPFKHFEESTVPSVPNLFRAVSNIGGGG
jgi:hypothetical protein